MCIGDSATRFRRLPSDFSSRALSSPSRSPCAAKIAKKSMPELRRNMSISDKDLRRLIENLDNHEGRLRRLETQEIGVSVSGGLVCLETQIVDGSETEITFSSIDQSFTHLWLLIHAGAVSPSIGAAMQLTFNGDSGSNYHSYSMEHIRDAVP